MEHLHPRFITAGLALGFGVLMIAVTIWQVSMWTASQQFALTAWLMQLSLFAGGLTLIIYSFFEIEHEARRTQRT